MYVTVRNSLGVMLLVFAAVASWYLSLPPTIVPTDEVVGETRPLGYYLRGARLLGTDANGHVTYVVSADRAEELPDQEQLELAGVRVEYSPENEIPWLVSATSASAPRSGEYLDLTGDVELRSQPSGGRDATLVQTASLRFEPNEFIARSDAGVTVTIGKQRLEAVGLRANLKDDSLQLESKIHGQFAP
jgi:LPS export ABC transporter protein LptC